MKKPKRTTDDLDEADIFSDDQLDVDDFVDTMGRRSGQGDKRLACRLLEERADLRRLREQLEDWDDWELADPH